MNFDYFDIGGKETFGGSSSNYEITTFVLHVPTRRDRKKKSASALYN